MSNIPELSSNLTDFCNSFIKEKKFTQTNFWGQENNLELNLFKKTVKDHFIKSQDYTCAYCRQKIKVSHNGSWDLEHIVSRDENPRWTLETINLCIVCKDCNGEKSNQKILNKKISIKVPTVENYYKIYHPHIDHYNEHITIVSAGEFYLPETKKGRATIKTCGLDRFFLKIAGVGKKSKKNTLLIRKILDTIEKTEDQKKIDKLYKLIEILAGNSRILIKNKEDENLENMFSDFLGKL